MLPRVPMPPQASPNAACASPAGRRTTALDVQLHVAPRADLRQRTPVHPGRFLARHYLAPLGLTQTAAARTLGVSRRRVNELVHAKRAMSADTAIRCAQAFGLTATAWLAMQAEWDAWQAWQALGERVPAVATAAPAAAAS